jgi:hypothetical protein
LNYYHNSFKSEYFEEKYNHQGLKGHEGRVKMKFIKSLCPSCPAIRLRRVALWLKILEILIVSRYLKVNADVLLARPGRRLPFP